MASCSHERISLCNTCTEWGSHLEMRSQNISGCRLRYGVRACITDGLICFCFLVSSQHSLTYGCVGIIRSHQRGCTMGEVCALQGQASQPLSSPAHLDPFAPHQRACPPPPGHPHPAGFDRDVPTTPEAGQHECAATPSPPPPGLFCRKPPTCACAGVRALPPPLGHAEPMCCPMPSVANLDAASARLGCLRQGWRCPRLCMRATSSRPAVHYPWQRPRHRRCCAWTSRTRRAGAVVEARPRQRLVSFKRCTPRLPAPSIPHQWGKRESMAVCVVLATRSRQCSWRSWDQSARGESREAS